MKRFEVQAKSPVVLRYLLVREDDKTPLVQADVSAVRYYVYDLDSEAEVTPSGGVSVPVTSFLFNTVQQWNVSDEGYNGRLEVAATYCTLGAKRVEVKITPTSGQPRYLEHVELNVTRTFSS